MTRAPWIVAALALVAACGDDATEMTVTRRPPRRDAGPFDAGPLPPFPIFDSGPAVPLIDGAPPDAFAAASCAIDTNKVFELVHSFDVPEPSQLAVDVVDSRFGVAYVDRSAMSCGNALYVAEIEGPSGAPPPEISVAIEECTMVRHPAITRSDDAWLFAIVDNRLPGLDVWAQAYDPREATARPAHRVTESLGEKSELQIAGLGAEGAMAAWVETVQDPDFERTDTLRVRALWPDGEPYLPEVVLESAPTRPTGCPAADPATESKACVKWLDRWSFHELRLARIGVSNAALVYRRDSRNGSEIVLRLVDLDGNALRDPRILTDEPGPDGNAYLATDEDGGAVIYTIGQGNFSREIWFQALDKNGMAAPVLSGGSVVGTAAPVEIVGDPQVAIDASVTKLPNGYAVAYRGLPATDANANGVPRVAGGTDAPQVRVLFLDRVGSFRGDSSLAFAESEGGRTSIAAAYDGRVVVAWTDAHADGSASLTAVRLPCVGR